MGGANANQTAVDRATRGEGWRGKPPHLKRFTQMRDGIVYVNSKEGDPLTLRNERAHGSQRKEKQAILPRGGENNNGRRKRERGVFPKKLGGGEVKKQPNRRGKGRRSPKYWWPEPKKSGQSAGERGVNRCGHAFRKKPSERPKLST